MAITERTKQIVAQQRALIQQKIDANLADIQDHQNAIDQIQAINDILVADLAALKKDIAEPTPVPEGVATVAKPK